MTRWKWALLSILQSAPMSISEFDPKEISHTLIASAIVFANGVDHSFFSRLEINRG